jgi:hypothetical protein
MRRLFIVWLLLCGTLFAGVHANAQFIGEGVFKSVARAVSCAGFTIDGPATSQPAGGGTTTTQALTIAGANEVIFSVITANGTGVSSTADNSGKTTGWTSPRASSTGVSPIFESWTTSTGAFSGATVTTTYSPSITGFVESIIFGVIGGHHAAPFDSGGASNVPQTGTASPLSININAPNSLALGFFRNSINSGSPATGWTQIAPSANFTFVEYKAFTSPQTSLSVSDPSGTTNGAIADALVCGP